MFQEATDCLAFLKKELRYFSSSSAESSDGGWLAWFEIGRIRNRTLPIGIQ